MGLAQCCETDRSKGGWYPAAFQNRDIMDLDATIALRNYAFPMGYDET